jgi:hypothetical protein
MRNIIVDQKDSKVISQETASTSSNTVISAIIEQHGLKEVSIPSGLISSKPFEWTINALCIPNL